MSRETLQSRTIAKTALLAVLAIAFAAFIVGCSGSGSNSSSNASSSSASTASSSAAASSSSAASLAGSELNIYCGAGMTDPFTEIASSFEEKTGCKMNVTYANAAQIQTQIKETQSGDFFIAGSKDELDPVKDSVESSTDLVKHIPVIAVPTANPKGIASLADLANCDTLLIGDPESTPVGKIAKKALTDAGIWETLNAKGAITTTTTAPQIATALAQGEGDAGIVWKENVKADGAEILDTTDLDSYVKVVPAAQLTSVADADAAQAFAEFLDTDAVHNIWTSFGYELVK